MISPIEFFQKSKKVIGSLENENTIKTINKIKNILFNAIKNERLIMIGGNGGSACDSDHFCSELVVRYEFSRDPIKCISLNSSTSHLTASSNDFGYDSTFKRIIECFGKENDILILLSTSGNSKNILEALKYGKSKNLKTICLLGKGGGEAIHLSDINIVIESNETALIQQAHMNILHYLAMEIELLVKDNEIFE